MEIQHTPPKKKVEFDISTPPRKENPEQSTALIKSSLKSSRKSTPKSFSPSKTPAKSLKKSTSQSSQEQHSRLDEDYYFHRLLGSGNFSSVGLYESKMTGQLFAIKRNKVSSMSVNQIQALATTSMMGEKNKSIIRYFHSWVEGQFCYIVMQYCQKSLTDIFDQFRQNNTQLTQDYLLRIFKDVLFGLEYLHSHNIVHLDLKPDNLLFNGGILKISDLGLCRLARVKKWMQLIQGDSRYLDRIILNYNDKTDLTKADIFSLGMTLYQAISLQQLPNNGQRWQQLRNGINLTNQPVFKNYSTNFLKTIELMINPDSQKRPSVHQLLQMNLFKSRRYDQMISDIENNYKNINYKNITSKSIILNSKSSPIKILGKQIKRDKSL